MGKYIRSRKEGDQFILEPTYGDLWFHRGEHVTAFKWVLKRLGIPDNGSTRTTSPKGVIPTNSPKEVKRITGIAGHAMRTYLTRNFPNRKQPSFWKNFFSR